jgi:predicted Zn finger-like uncharacterized protein
MPIQITCPSCSRQLRVPDNLVGQYVKCPSCDKTFTASAEESAAPKESSQEESPKREREVDTYTPAESPRRPRPPQRDDDDDDFDRDRPRPSRRSSRSRSDYAPHRGTLILILGVLSLTGAGLFTGIPAWIMGNHDMAEIRAGRMDPEGESNTNIGRILGMVSTILGLVGCVCGGGCWLLMMGGMAAGAK